MDAWLEGDDSPIMKDTSVSPELVLESVVRSPREVREARASIRGGPKDSSQVGYQRRAQQRPSGS